jgi:hypothetical protein
MSVIDCMTMWAPTAAVFGSGATSTAYFAANNDEAVSSAFTITLQYVALVS